MIGLRATSEIPVHSVPFYMYQLEGNYCTTELNGTSDFLAVAVVVSL